MEMGGAENRGDLIAVRLTICKPTHLQERCPMTGEEIASALRRVIRGELDDVERALHRGDVQRALSELDDAITKIKRIAARAASGS
jgi:hypothetical protein